jgi:hypothetical protein
MCDYQTIDSLQEADLLGVNGPLHPLQNIRGWRLVMMVDETIIPLVLIEPFP